MNAETQPASSPPVETLTLVVFGKDGSGKAHGSAFSERDAELAARAAEMMGMRTLAVRTEAEGALAAKVPRGRVFASGRAFVPFIKATLLAELQTAAFNSPLTALTPSNGGAASEVSKPAEMPPAKASDNPPWIRQPTNWGDIKVGAIVLATYAPDKAEWYECVVVAVEGKDTFRLRYCDFPRLPPFIRKRGEVALIHPTYPLELPLDPEQPTEVA